MGLPDREKNFEDMFNRLHRIPACDGQTDDRQTDRQTDGQTFYYGIVRAMHTRRAVITRLDLSCALSAFARWRHSIIHCLKKRANFVEKLARF